MAEPILKTDIPRESDCLYFCKGNPIVVYKAKMSRGGRKAKKKKAKKE
jgi:hypothetical protein